MVFVVQKQASYDGLELDLYVADGSYSRTVVFVNAFGISAAIATPLAEQVLAAGANFVTWECRGAPGPYREPHTAYDPDDHVRDFISVIDALGLSQVVALGWCSGGEIALGVAHRCPERIARLILVSPYLSFVDPSPTTVGTSLEEMIGMVAADATRARMFYEIMKRSGRDAQVLGLLEDPEMLDFVSAPFESGAEFLYRYAGMLARLYRNRVLDWCGSVRVPTLAIGGGRDVVSHAEHVERLARAMPNAKSEVFDDADHYGLFRHPGVLARVCLEASGRAVAGSERRVLSV